MGQDVRLLGSKISLTVLNVNRSIQRIVITSSTAAIVHNDPNPILLNEEDWNEQSPQEAEELGEKTPPLASYRASKTLAERGW